MKPVASCDIIFKEFRLTISQSEGTKIRTLSPLKFGQGPSYMYIVTTALLVSRQCFRKSLYKTIEGPSTRPTLLSVINGSYCCRRRRLTIFESERDKIPWVFDPSQFVNYITVDDWARASVWHIFLGRNITKFLQKFGLWSKGLSKCFSKLI